MSFKKEVNIQDIISSLLRIGIGRQFEHVHTTSSETNAILTSLLQELHLGNNIKNRKKISKLLQRNYTLIVATIQPSEECGKLVHDENGHESINNRMEPAFNHLTENNAADTDILPKLFELPKSTSKCLKTDIKFTNEHYSSLKQISEMEIKGHPSQQKDGKCTKNESIDDELNNSMKSLHQPTQNEVIVDPNTMREPFAVNFKHISEVGKYGFSICEDRKCTRDDPIDKELNSSVKSLNQPTQNNVIVDPNTTRHPFGAKFKHVTEVESKRQGLQQCSQISGGVMHESDEIDLSELAFYNATKFTRDDLNIRILLQRMDEVEGNINSQKLKFSIKHGYILFSNEIFNKKNNEKDNRSALYGFMRKNITNLNLSCILTFKGNNSRGSSTDSNNERVVCYAHCVHKKCEKRFRFDIIFREDIYIALVHSNGKLECHDEKCVAQARGSDRKEAKMELNSYSSYQYRIKKIKEADNLQLDLGNLQEIRPLKTIQKMNQEKARENLKSQHDILDMIHRYEDEKFILHNQDQQYIQHVQQPLGIQCFSTNVINNLKIMLKEFDKQNKFVLYFDATGSLVRAQRGQLEGPVYYYAGVVSVDGITIPILENITNQHTMEAICTFLLHFKAFCKRHRKWPLFSVVVVDFSYAFIRAIILSWNEMSLENYLSLCHSYYQNRTKITKTNMRQVVLVHICCAHMIGIIKRFCGKNKIKGRLKQFIMEGMALLIQSQTLQRAFLIVFHFLYILQSKYFDENVQTRLNRLTNFLTEVDEFLIATIEKPEIEVAEGTDIITETLEKGLRKNSPFRRLGVRVNKAVKRGIRITAKENKNIPNKETNYLYCPAFAERLLTLYIPLLPLWTGIMLHVPFPRGDVTRLSNANVESWFKKVKTHIYEGKKNMRPGLFVETMKEQVSIMLKELTYVPRPKTKRSYAKNRELPTTVYESSKVEFDDENSDECDNNLECIPPAEKKSKKNDVHNTLLTERWRKRRKSRYSIFKGNNISKYSGSKKQTKTPPKVEHVESKPCFNESDVSLKPCIEPQQQSITCVSTLSVSEEVLDSVWKTEEKRLRNVNSDYEYKRSDWFGSYAKKEDILCLYNSGKAGEMEQCLIDECCSAFLDRYLPAGTNMMYIPMCFSHTIIGYLTETFNLYGEGSAELNAMNWNDADKLLIPFLPSPGHFSLAVINMQKKCLTVLDPISMPKELAEQRMRQVLHQFKVFMTIKSMNSREFSHLDLEWDIKYIDKYQRQSDNFNCGVYVMWYVHQLLREADLDEKMDPTHFRKIICWHLFPTNEVVNKEMRDKGMYPHPQAMFTSGLFQDVEYYCGKPEILMEYVVAKFMNLFKDPVLISGEDFASLNATNWLSGTAIDACLSALLNDYDWIQKNQIDKGDLALLNDDQWKRRSKTINFRVFKTVHAALLIQKNYSISYDLAKRSRLLPVDTNIEYFVFPINSSGRHWTVLFIDITAGTYQFYDSIDNSQEEKMVYELVENFTSNYNDLLLNEQKINHEIWMNVTPADYPMQNDTNSCGLFVIIYAYKFIFGNYLSIFGLRKRLQIKLLCDSRNMMNACLYCGVHETPLMFRRKKTLEWVSCAACKRWVHYKCVKVPKVKFEDMNGAHFTCVLCEVALFNPLSSEPQNTIEIPVSDPYHFYSCEDNVDILSLGSDFKIDEVSNLDNIAIQSLDSQNCEQNADDSSFGIDFSNNLSTYSSHSQNEEKTSNPSEVSVVSLDLSFDF